MIDIIKYTHHKVPVSVIESNKGKHREHCLCWQGCRKFFPANEDKNCIIASQLYSFDKIYNVTTPVWECAEYA